MSREDIIRMGREADSGFDGGPDSDGTMTDSLVGMAAIERFAALVAAAERDACAKVCSDLLKNQVVRSWATQKEMEAFGYCADKIRNRGNGGGK